MMGMVPIKYLTGLLTSSAQLFDLLLHYILLAICPLAE